jgi:protein-S-isoprenylcysteine O-methyltransferase Ste14
MAKPRLSYALVLLQFLALAVIAITGPWLARTRLLLLLEFAGFGLLGWALWSMRRSAPNITPDVRANAALVQDGPYRFVRHPMYLALLLITLALVLEEATPLRVVTWLLLVATLLVKLNYEERLLAARFPAYQDYQRTTKRLVPFLY